MTISYLGLSYDPSGCPEIGSLLFRITFYRTIRQRTHVQRADETAPFVVRRRAALFCRIVNYSWPSNVSPPDTLTSPGDSSTLSFFTTPSSTSME